jgi:hypothetical protein
MSYSFTKSNIASFADFYIYLKTSNPVFVPTTLNYDHKSNLTLSYASNLNATASNALVAAVNAYSNYAILPSSNTSYDLISSNALVPTITNSNLSTSNLNAQTANITGLSTGTGTVSKNIRTPTIVLTRYVG